jgi:hypothetical protein
VLKKFLFVQNLSVDSQTITPPSVAARSLQIFGSERGVGVPAFAG